MLAAEGLLTLVDRVAFVHHRDAGGVGADVEHGDHHPVTTVGQLLDDPLDGGARGVGLDVDHHRLEARGLGHGDAVLDLLLARGGDQHFHVVGGIGNGAQHLEVQAHLVEREGDVLVGFALDLHLELFLAQAGGQGDALGDHRRSRQRHRHVLDLGARLAPGPTHGLGHDVDLVDVAVDNGAPRQRLDGVALEPQVALAGLGQLHQLDAGRADVEPDQRRRLGGKWQFECQGSLPVRSARGLGQRGREDVCAGDPDTCFQESAHSLLSFIFPILTTSFLQGP